MAKTKTIISIMLFFIAGCTVVYSQPPTGQNNTSNSATSTVADDGERKPANISEAITACNNIQQAQNIPVGCSVEYINGKPAMVIGFPDTSTLKQYISAFTEIVADPFCESANESNRQALLFYVVKDKNMANMYSCESDELTGWFDLSELSEETSTSSVNWRPSNMSEVIDLCKQIQRDQDIPVGCAFQYIEGIPAVYVVFPDASIGRHYIYEVAEYIALPFCSSTNQANRQGLLAFVAQREKVANFYNCESNEFTGWFSLNKYKNL